MKYGHVTFSELHKIAQEGLILRGIHHDVHIVSCSDWKASACIEGYTSIHVILKCKISSSSCSVAGQRNHDNAFAGLKSATAKYFCRYCFCTKEQLSRIRGTTCSMYHSQVVLFLFWKLKCLQKFYIFISFADIPQWLVERTCATHNNLLSEWNNKSCVRQMLINVEPSQCPPDMLHMKKGIITKLVNQLVDWAVLQGRTEHLLRQMKDNKIPFRYYT